MCSVVIDYRPDAAWPVILAANRDEIWLRHRGVEHGADRIEAIRLAPGLSMLTAHDLNDPASGRIRGYLPRFQAAPRPDVAATGDSGWSAWEALLAGREGDGPYDAMAVVTEAGFGTVSSALIALPAAGSGSKPIWRFATGLPGPTPFVRVVL